MSLEGLSSLVQPSLKSVGKIRSLHKSTLKAPTLPAHARLLVLTGTNTLAFKKIRKLWVSVITLGPVPNVIKLVTIVIYEDLE